MRIIFRHDVIRSLLKKSAAQSAAVISRVWYDVVAKSAPLLVHCCKTVWAYQPRATLQLSACLCVFSHQSLNSIFYPTSTSDIGVCADSTYRDRYHIRYKYTTSSLWSNYQYETHTYLDYAASIYMHVRLCLYPKNGPCATSIRLKPSRLK